MNEWVFALATGLISGFLFVGVEKLFSNIIIPKIRASILKVPKVEGNWDGFDIDENGNEDQNSRLEIIQTGTRIKGKSIRKSKRSGKERIFSYTGFINAGQIVLTFEEQDGKGFIIGSMVLSLASNLREMNGQSTYFHHDEGKVISRKKIYRKIA